MARSTKQLGKFFCGSAWKYDAATDQYYYHSFAEEQADLNWQNQEVRQAVFDVLQFWLDRGVDGFRFDVINNLTVSDQFIDNPVGKDGKQDHRNDVNQPGIKRVLKELNQWIKAVDPSIFTVAEISSDQLSLINSYTEDGLFDTAFHFNLGSMEALDLEKLARDFKEMSQQKKMPTLFFNSHDMSRSWQRLANENRDIYRLLTVFLLINRGIPFYFREKNKVSVTICLSS
ncbi:alpha-amylase family glycosyl hydrolase [Enterococcus gallinarum]|nr:alpha-amylase family glycosyl hydrolase [Enterococcus gallinarum]